MISLIRDTTREKEELLLILTTLPDPISKSQAALTFILVLFKSKITYKNQIISNTQIAH